MAIFSVNNVRITGVAGCVPLFAEDNIDYDWITQEERELLIKTTGVKYRRKVQDNKTAADMCVAAAQGLMEKMQI